MHIFNRVKAVEAVDTKSQINDMILACDMDRMLKARAKTLSGGQKRKLQLAMMFTGGSKICCVDEVSSGYGPVIDGASVYMVSNIGVQT